MDARELGKQVLTRRKEKNLSQEELGKIADISRNYVSLIERGKADSISKKVIDRLAVALGATPGELTGEATASLVLIPPSLREFGLKNNLSYSMIDKLAHIPRRGKEPKTVGEWELLYQAILPFIEDEPL
jgi:transcriptional regulator with XRE-family HTH domain